MIQLRIRKRLEFWERWLRTHIQRSHTKRIEDEQRRYMHNFKDVHTYLDKLKAANEHNVQIIEALKKRMGI